MVQKALLVHGETYYDRWKHIPSRVITTRLYTVRTNLKKPVYVPAEPHVKAASREPSKNLAHGYLTLQFASGFPGAEGVAPLKGFPIETLIGPDFELLEERVPEGFRIGFAFTLYAFVGPYDAVMRQKRAEADVAAETRTMLRTQYNHAVKLANDVLGDDPLPEFTNTYEEVPCTVMLTIPQLRRLLEGNVFLG